MNCQFWDCQMWSRMWKNPVRKEKIQTRHSRDSEGWGGRAAFHTRKCLNLTHTHAWTLPHTCFLSFTHILYWNCVFASLFMWFVLSCFIRWEAHAVAPRRQDRNTKATLKVPLSCMFMFHSLKWKPQLLFTPSFLQLNLMTFHHVNIVSGIQNSQRNS